MFKVKQIVGLLFLCFWVSYSSAQINDTLQNGINKISRKSISHKVEKGETLYKISKTYSITVNDIVEENPEAIDGIKEGQTLKIPVIKKTAEKVKEGPKEKTVFTERNAGKPPIDTSKYVIHVVEKGQTMYSIAKKYDVSEDEIKKVNPGMEGLKKGSKIAIPKKRVKSIKDSTNVEPAVIEKRDIYNIALFLPFIVEKAAEVDVDKVVMGDEYLPSKTDVAISFYNGILLAMDSMKRAGFNCKLFVYDVDENDSAMIAELMKKPELKQMDLFIGPLYNSSFMRLAKFAKENKIHCVTPLSQQNKVLFNNAFVSKTIPSQVYQLTQMCNYIADKYANDNIVLVTTMGTKEAEVYTAIKQKLGERLKSIRSTKADTLIVAKGLTALSVLSSTKKNIVIVPSNNQVFVTDFVTKLNNSKGKYHIILFGMPSWKSFDNLDLDYLDTLHFHFPSASFIDNSQSYATDFIEKYQQQFMIDPDVFAYLGYDIGMFYFGLMNKNGRNISSFIHEAVYMGIQSGFKMVKPDAGGGADNQSVLILKQSRHTIQKAE